MSQTMVNPELGVHCIQLRCNEMLQYVNKVGTVMKEW